MTPRPCRRAPLWSVWMVLALLPAACVPSTGSWHAPWALDAGPDLAAALDDSVAAPDAASETDAASAATEVLGPEDVAGGVCPGGPRCACAVDGDCDGAICLEAASGRICAATCAGGTGCLSNESCQYVPSGGDPVAVCVPRWVSLCAPCTSAKDCATSLPMGGLLCAQLSGSGSFCSAACSKLVPCPDGFTCEDSPPRCVPVSGVCGCSAWAVAQASTGECFTTTAAGTCKAPITCTAIGPLPACLAASATAETCNGVDDDCNSVIDDGADATCDDGSPCTADFCSGGQCGSVKAVECGDGACAAPCGETPLTCAADCHTCGDGVCSPGEGPKNCLTDCCGSCGDGKCKGYECGEDKPGDKTCPLDCGTACGNKVCDKGESPSTCAQDCQWQVCGNNACEASDGGPTVCPEDCGTACGNCSCDSGEDFSNCSVDCGFCGDGICSLCDTAGESPKTCPADCGDLKLIGCTTMWAMFCKDDTPCSQDLCAPGKGCVHLPAAATCTDGDTCTLGDACNNAVCAPGAAMLCDDGNKCTSDSCDPASGCVFVNLNGGECSDGNGCTVGDACSGGACVAGSPLDCQDKTVCTTDSCDAISGCQHADNALGCDDNNPCTVTDLCAGGTCVGSGAAKCDDGNPCTTDGCDPAKGCTTAPDANNGAACPDDGKPCTSDLCSGGACTHAAQSGPCTDNNACTLNDSCSGGNCAAGPAKDCSDNNACTADSCAPATGSCSSQAVSNGTTCSAGICYSGACCTPQTVANACAGKNCGSVSLGCGKSGSCGTCGAGTSCSAGICKSTGCSCTNTQKSLCTKQSLGCHCDSCTGSVCDAFTCQ